MEIVVGAILSAILAGLLMAFDEAVFGTNIAWWLCIIIAIVVVFIGTIIVINVSDD